MKTYYGLWLCAAILTGVSPSASAFFATVTRVPTSAHGVFGARITGDVNDPRPNPCYGEVTCLIQAFVIDESWLPDQPGGAASGSGEYLLPRGKYTFQYATLGEWWAAVTDKNRELLDYSVDPNVTRPCITLAYSFSNTMAPGPGLSNCARALVPAPTCTLRPPQINVRLTSHVGEDVQPQPVPDVSLTCTEGASIRIETNTDEKIPLGGSDRAYALLDWGRGWGGPGLFHVAAGSPTPVPLQIKTVGLDRLDAGTVSGSSIINVVYD